jgi:hypothetical protein
MVNLKERFMRLFRKKKTPTRQPRDLDDALNMLEAGFGPEGLAQMRNMSSDEFSAAVHMGTGMNVRNNWCLWWYEGHNYEGWPKKKPGLVDYFNKLGIYHADDISGILMKSFYRRVTGKPLDIVNQLPRYKNHWKGYGYKDGIYTPGQEPTEKPDDARFQLNFNDEE